MLPLRNTDVICEAKEAERATSTCRWGMSTTLPQTDILVPAAHLRLGIAHFQLFHLASLLLRNVNPRHVADTLPGPTG